ncbi:hypothetical protein B0H14DRAFT_3881316 [Mycena olivaceomarginata]|nr:hypothetical protein B0H14DRAFT_3881316 [Mycena olivaceomarginata]
MLPKRTTVVRTSSSLSAESYRPSPASPSPVLQSEEEDELPIAPHVLGEEEAAAAFVPAEYDLVPAPSEQAGSPAALQPPSPAWGNGSAISLSPEAPPATPLVPEPSPPAAPPPVAKVFSRSGGHAGHAAFKVGPRPISLTLSAFTTCPSSRLFFSGGGSSLRSPTSLAPPSVAGPVFGHREAPAALDDELNFMAYPTGSLS